MAEYPYAARATLKYKGPPGSNDSLSFGKGDLITVLGAADEDGEWLRGRDPEGNEGMFPEQFIEKVEEPAVEEITEPVVEEAAPVPAPQAAKPAPIKQDKPIAAPASQSDAPEPARGGSFKDRIAAFNKPTTGPPPVKAKPPTIGRKPQPAPPAQPKPEMPATSSSESKAAQGLSASDAKESIARGGSLKDRIAALQGGFKAEHMQPPAPGKAPPKPWKKPAPAEEEKPASPSTEEKPIDVEAVPSTDEGKAVETESSARSLSPPSTVPMPAIPRRTGPPRRRAPAAVTPKKEEDKQLGQEETTLSQPDDMPGEQQPAPEAGEARQVPLEDRVPSEPNLQSLNLNEGGPKSPTIREPEQTLSVVPPSHSRTSSSDSLQPPSPMHKPSLPLPPRLETERVDEALEEEQSKRASLSPNELSAPEPMHQPSLPIPPARDALPGSDGEGATSDEPGEMDEEPVDEEEEERKRKEGIMKRMAAMGGQRIGAPMMPPARKESESARQVTSEVSEPEEPKSAAESSVPKPPMRMPPPPARPPSDDEDEDEQQALSDNEQNTEEREEAAAAPVRVAPPTRLPPPPMQHQSDESEGEDDQVQEAQNQDSEMPPLSQHPNTASDDEDEGEIAPPPPPRALPRPPSSSNAPASPTSKPSLPPINTASRPAVPQARKYSQDATSPSAIESARETKASTSPISARRESYRAPTPTSPRPPVPQVHSRHQSMVFDEEKEEEEHAQYVPAPVRRTSMGSPRPPIPQQRMSMSFDEPVSPPPLSPRMSMSGVASIPMHAPVQEEEVVATETAPIAQTEETEPAQELTEEEEEAERRQRIAARMAKLGGLKMGMLPMHAGPKSAKAQTTAESEAESPIEPPAAQKRSNALQGGVALPGISMPRPPPREPSPEPTEENEESLKDEQEIEASREILVSPTSPRPPIPSRAPPPAIDTSFGSRPLPEAPEDDIPMPQSPPPPVRPSGGHSRQSSLAAPMSALSMGDSDDGRISLDMGSQDSHGSAGRQSIDAPRQSVDIPRQSIESSRQSTDQARPLPAQPGQVTSPESQPAPAQEASPVTYSSSDLIAFSERIGSQIFAKARTKSKEGGRWLGDSGPANFVAAVLAEVPDAQPPTNFNYGALVWSSQMGTMPTASQIRLGDIFVAHHAKIKGKGIGSHSTNLGSANAPYSAVVSDDYDTKKSKIRVYEVAGGKVDSGSHHLDLLKEGLLQVYRVTPRS